MALQFMRKFELTRDWQFSDPIDAVYNTFHFENTLENPKYYQTGIVAMVNAPFGALTNESEFFGYKKLYAQEQGSVFLLESPPQWTEKRIAIRRNRRYISVPKWEIYLSYDPDGVSETKIGFNATTLTLNLTYLSPVLILPTDAKRTQAIIRNVNQPGVYLGFNSDVNVFNATMILSYDQSYTVPETYKGEVWAFSERVRDLGANPFSAYPYLDSNVKVTIFNL